MEPLSPTARAFLDRAQRGEAPSATDRDRVSRALVVGSPGGMGDVAASVGGGAKAAVRVYLVKSVPMPRVLAAVLTVFVAGVATGRALSGQPPEPRVRPATAAAPESPHSAAVGILSPSEPTASPTVPTSQPLAIRAKAKPSPALNAAGETGADDAMTLLRAKRELDTGHAALAMKELESHERAYPHSTLSEEREALRVVALCALRRPEGADERSVFLRGRPLSPYVERVRAACGAPRTE